MNLLNPPVCSGVGCLRVERGIVVSFLMDNMS